MCSIGRCYLTARCSPIWSYDESNEYCRLVIKFFNIAFTFGLFWSLWHSLVTFGHFWLHLATLVQLGGVTSPHTVHQCDPMSIAGYNNIVSFLDYFVFLATFGHFWPLLATFGHFWLFLATCSIGRCYHNSHHSPIS